MKVTKLLFGLSLLVFMVGCQVPRIYIGKTSGIVSYDRLNHRLEILWENEYQDQGRLIDTTKVAPETK